MFLSRKCFLYSAMMLLVCIPASKYCGTNALVDDVVEILKLGKDITSTLLETWNLVEQTNLGGEVEIPFRKEKQKKIVNRINEVSRRINTFEDNNLNLASWTVESISDFIQADTKLELNLHELADLLNRIRSQSKVMRTFVMHFHDLERSTLEDFASRATAQDTLSIPGLMDRIHLLTTGSDDLENFGNVGIFH